MPVLPDSPTLKFRSSARVVAPLRVNAPVPEAKVPATIMCKSLPPAKATLPLNVTAPVPVEKAPALDWAKAVQIGELPVLPVAPTVKSMPSAMVSPL